MHLHVRGRTLIPSATDQHGPAWMDITDPRVMEWAAMYFHHSLLSLSKGRYTIYRSTSHFGHCFQGNDAPISTIQQ